MPKPDNRRCRHSDILPGVISMSEFDSSRTVGPASRRQ
jgi:hypothetical protein